jgi:diguanylate cyclase (GGDEF)-like protein/PAS domain S-box-containing protein
LPCAPEGFASRKRGKDRFVAPGGDIHGTVSGFQRGDLEAPRVRLPFVSGDLDSASITIKVVIVDDDPRDAESQIDELRRGGLAFEVRIATGESEFRREIVDFVPDVVLSEDALPAFDSQSVLRVLRDLAPDTPVIVVSSAIGEERAAWVVRDGAADYVLKQNLARLPEAVTRAIDDARRTALARVTEFEFDAAYERVTALLANVDSALSSYSLAEERYYYVSPAVCRVYGRPAEDFYRNDVAWHEFVHPEDVATFFALQERMLAEGVAEDQFRVIHADGSVHWVTHRAKVAYDHNRVPLRVDSVGADITERMEQQRQIERLRRIRDVLSAVNSAIVRIHEPAELCEEACRIATNIGGLPIAMMVTVDTDAGAGEIQALIGDVPRDTIERSLERLFVDPDLIAGTLAESMRAGRPIAENDVESRLEHTPESRWLFESGVRAIASFPFTMDVGRKGSLLLGSYERDFFNEDEIELLAALTNNLAFKLELAAKRERVNYLSYYDPLTGLPNRSFAQERLGQEISASARRGDRLALLVFDLRQFAYVNSTLGDVNGDAILREIARRLRDQIGSENVARIAGDRFSILIPELKALKDVMSALGAHGVRLLTEPIEAGGRELRLTAHVGCAVYPADGDDAKTIFRKAEIALKSAKGTDAPYRFYSAELNQRLERRIDLEARLHRATFERQFVMHYQPKVELTRRSIVGVEALIRWKDPTRPGQLIPPNEFIPVLEETGLIKEVGRWAIGEAVRQRHAWLAAGFAAPRIAVNVSAVQLGDRDLVDDVADALSAFPSDPGLDLEVTESGVMGNMREAIDTLRSIHDLGVEIAIDDFGTGYSSLSYLFQLPISAMKIDRSFIDGMTTNESKMTIVSTMVSLGRDLNLRVIAEGVETEEQAKLLRRLRCDEIQGYLVGRPMAANDLARLLTPH